MATDQPATAPGALDFSIVLPSDELGQIKERELALLDTLVLLHGLGVDSATLQPAAVIYSEHAPEFDGLTRSSVPPSPDQLKRLKWALNLMEEAFLAVEQQVPMELFKKHFDEYRTGKNAVSRYSSLLASRPFGTTDRRDRYEFLATRALRLIGSDGRYRFLPQEQLTVALNYVGRPDAMAGDDAARKSAVNHLMTAATRIGEFRNVDEIFKSGWYINLYGFKTTLGNKICDPAVLQAVVAVNIALGNRIQEISASSAAVRETSTRLASAEVEAKKVLTEALAGDEEAVVSQRFREQRKRVKREIGVRLEEVFQSVRQAQLAWRVIGAGLVLALGALALYLNLRRPPNQVAIPDAELRRLSPLLISGSYVYDEEKSRTLWGQLRTKAWQGIEPEQRREAFDGLRDELDSRKVKSAVLEVDGRPVARITSSGEIILVE